MSNDLVIVHGVQTGDDEDAIAGPKKMDSALRNLVSDRFEFSSDFPAYEQLNDDSLEKLQKISKLILTALESPVSGVFGQLVDLVGDVFVYIDDAGGAAIRDHVRKVVEKNPGCVLAGHSLGSVVCFDIVAELMNEGLFADKPREDWPVKSLITFGSPLALDMFSDNRQLVQHDGHEAFQWYNYVDRHDPIVSGNIFGSAFKENRLMRSAYNATGNQYHVHDRQIETGFHLLAHTHYWKNKYIINRLAQQMA
jgi:hypothetical protein